MSCKPTDAQRLVVLLVGLAPVTKNHGGFEMTKQEAIRWTELLEEAVSKPGIISQAYNMFHGYSIGNRMLALWQCMVQGIEPGPIAG